MNKNKNIENLKSDISSVKWGHLVQTGSGFSKFLTTLKLLKTTKVTISQKNTIF